MDYLKRIKETISNTIPPEAMISNVELEGPEIAIYTKNPKAFFENENYVAKIASELKKRVNIRTDKSLLTEIDQAKAMIEKIVPKEADIKEIMFNPVFSEVVIESIKPGLVIGKGGETSKRIILETGWTPKIIRAPTSPSEILKGIRHHMHKYANERKKILQDTAKKIYDTNANLDSWIRMTALGSFQEVGRSCILVETRDTKVMMDCGVSVASFDDPFPYLDAIRFPINELDAVIISHAHLDHTGFLPYLYKLGYDGPTYCTDPTRDLMALLQFDYVDVMVKEGREPPYTERDVKEAAKHCITRDYREVTDIAPDMRLTFHNAAHILGSASVHLHIGEGGHNIVYSADIKYGFTRLFDMVDIKYPRLETLILESTYGAQNDIQPQREEAEQRLVQVIKETIAQGGNVLIPVFAVGRAQEMMLVVENAYRLGQLPEGIKVYIDGMTKEASAIHTAYPEYLRKNVEKRVLQNDSPFTSPLFQVAPPNARESILTEGGAVIIATSGMLTGGPAVYYLHNMAENPRNTLIFVGYQAEGSPGRKVQSGIRKIPITGQNGRVKELALSLRIETVEGFSGHSDRQQLVSYVRNLKPKPRRILTNHGERSKTIELSKYLSLKFHTNANAIKNLETVRLK